MATKVMSRAAQAKAGRAAQPKLISSKVVYRGPVFYVTSDRVREPHGNRTHGIEVRRDVVRHPGSVVIMVVDDASPQTRLLLARQYRYAAGQPLWEFPAGRIDHGESPLAGAKRELLEETGYTARHWKLALNFWVSPGFLDETMALFVAKGLVRGAAKPEEDEFIRKRLFPLPAAVKMVNAGKIRDAKTIAGILWLAQHKAK
jgi:ADP-ribose pyrophosphatase